MNASLDRFSVGFTPTVAVEIGTCEGCGGVMYNYELATCHTCGAKVHQGCKGKCEICGRPGCRACLTQDPETGERRCEENCEKDMKDEPILLCRCGWRGTIDEQDALGTEMGCCPVCGNEDLQEESEATHGK